MTHNLPHTWMPSKPKRNPPGIWNRVEDCIPDFNEEILIKVDHRHYVAKFTSAFIYAVNHGRSGLVAYHPQLWMAIPKTERLTEEELM